MSAIPTNPTRLAVILNATAGGGHDDAARAVREAFARRGLEAEVHVAGNGADLDAAVARALRRGPAILVAAGGDGTVSAVASHARKAGVALAVLPLGTLNHFAKDLGIPQDVEGAVQAIADGRRVDIDLGEVNDRAFINNASLGLYPDIVRDRARRQRRLGHGKYRAMLWATLAVLRRSPFLRLRMEIDGRPTHCRAPFVFIGNNDYAMEGFEIGTRSSLRDGRLSVYTTRRRTRWGLVRLAFRALFGRLSQADDFTTANAATLEIDAPRRRRLLVATDGEVTALETPLRFRVLPGALQVIVPAHKP